MARIYLFILFLAVAHVAPAQLHLYHSDHNTPIIQPTACNCDDWASPYSTVDSSRRRVSEVRYKRGGVNYRRTYFITSIDTTFTDICNESGGCKGASRVRVSTGYRTWFTDVSTGGFRILSFTLPACSDQTVNVKDVADVKLEGSGDLSFSPKTLTVPTDVPSRTETVTVTGNGQTLTATIVMVNPAQSLANNAADQEKMKRLGEVMNTAAASSMNKVNNLLRKSLGSFGEWKGNSTSNIRINTAPTDCPGQPGCLQKGFQVTASGEAGFSGRVSIPVTALPVLGKYFAGADISTSLGGTWPLDGANGTTCTGNPVCTSGTGKVTGGGTFAFRAPGFRAEGQVVSEGGTLGGNVCVWPQVDMKEARFNSGKLNVVGKVEDKWGMAQWDVNFTIWNGISAPLNND